MRETIHYEVDGHLKITDDLGQVLVDKHNAVHPQNMARVISRSLSNENNFFIHSVAFGNGGTIVDAAFTITYRTPNDGQLPDTAAWESRLYNETYREIVDDSNINIGEGEGSDSSGDPPSVEHVSGPGVRSTELGLTSEVEIVVVLNPGEPLSQFLTDDQSPAEATESDFTFDEIGLYTTGLPNTATSGFQDVNVGDKLDTSDTGLAPSTLFDFEITVDGGSVQSITITTPVSGSGSGGEILYSDLTPLINAAITGATATISDQSTVITFGFLRFTSNSTGSTSTILLADNGGINTALFASLTDFVGINPAVGGDDQGVQNAPVNPTTERERLLAHVIFSPVLKAANRTLTIDYTLTVSVARSTT